MLKKLTTYLHDILKFCRICEIKAYDLVKMDQTSPGRHIIEPGNLRQNHWLLIKYREESE
jgi:hypothetical protein